MKGIFDKIAFTVFLLSLAFAIYLGGLLSARFNLYPAQLLRTAIREYSRQFENPDRLIRAVYDYSGVKIHDADRIAPGSTFITSYFPEFDWKAGAQLIDRDGTVLHSWPVDHEALFPGVYVQQNYIHGSHLFPNGDILINLEFMGLARISACGDTVWTYTDSRAHHSISTTSDGNFWISGNRARDGGEADAEFFERHPYLEAPVFEDLMVKISPEGEVLKEISAVDVVFGNGLDAVLYRRGKPLTGDIFHLNDVEEIPAEMLADFPMFAQGDIVVSFRDLHTVMVLDPDTGDVKWSSIGETTFQHDPDFLADGWIAAFDNRLDRTFRGTELGGSRIFAMNPETGERKVLFPTPNSDPFYTSWSGKWQMLDNGNMLLTEARAGHAVEVAPTGETVWEWVHERFDEDRIAEVMEASRYPYDAEDVAGWTCD